jgi:ABC-type antimicrobial peptide transport system permease subunit
MSFANYLIVLEDLRPIEAIKNSFKYTKRYTGKIILTSLLIGVPLGVINLIFHYINRNVFGENAVSGFSLDVMGHILLLIFSVAFFNIYHISWIERNSQ